MNAATHPDPLPEVIGPYRILRKLGAGGMGAVYEALHEAIERRVAIKVLHPQYARSPEFTARFFNEARAVNRVDHPGLVQISDYGQLPDGMAYIIMELLRGESLASRIRQRGGALSLPESLNIGWQLADALAAAHHKQVVHRDLKPDNLMLVADAIAPGGERVKVLDFGIAKLTLDNEPGGIKTHTQAVMGTPMYMSPEQCAGAGGVDAKSDVYSLGCVLYQMLGGRPPFDGNGAGQLIGKHLYEEPPALGALAPTAPRAVIELVHRLLIKDKLLRPSMSETADVLGHLRSELAGAGPITLERSVIDTANDATRPLSSARPSTTLGHSIGQQRSSTSRRNRLIVFGVTAGMLFAFVVVDWRGQTPSQPGLKTAVPRAAKDQTNMTQTPSQLPAQQMATRPALVRWDVNTEPPGAIVLNQTGDVLGKTPWTQEHPAHSGRLTLRLRSNGYSEATIELDESVDATKKLQLKRIPLPKPPTGKLKPMRSNHRPLTAQPTEMIYEP